jgi:hypothetical protein
MRASKIISLSFLALAAIASSIVACSTTVSSSTACDSICAITSECGGSNCLAECIRTEATCSSAGQSSAFDSFASCNPIATCGAAGFGIAGTGCTSASVGLVLCGPGLFGSLGGSTNPPPGSDGGIPPTDAGHDGPVIVVGDGDVPDSSGDDAQGDDAQGDDAQGDDAQGDDAQGDDSGCGFCQSTCENSCGESCTGGECSTCVPNGSCSTSCVDNCGNSCTGGSCAASCVPDGTCDYSCEDNCGNYCTGGDAGC